MTEIAMGSVGSGVRPAALLRFLRLALAVRRERQELKELPPCLLSDIGVTPDEARIEASRSMWDVAPR